MMTKQDLPEKLQNTMELIGEKMNRYIKTSIYYAIFGLAAGVFYREFTKFNGLDGGTSLAFIHVHTLIWV